MTALLADAFVKATLVLLIALGTAVLLRRSAAALRHLVWALACAGVLALPVASVALPDLQIAAWPRLDVPVQFDARQIETPTVPPRLQPQPTRAATAQRPEPATSAPTSDVAPIGWRLHPDWRSLVLPVWLTGVALVMIALTIGLVRIAWLGRTASPVRDERWLTLVEELARSIGLRKHVRLLQSSGPAMPMTWGIRRPVILLPADLDEWPAERRRDVLLHELAHVKRYDFLTQLIARMACAIYWFHPLVWLAATRLREERERACDDHVLRAGTKPSAYASNLLEIARALRASPTTSLASVAMARPAQLATRLLDVLDARRCRDTLSPRAAAPAWILAALVVVPLAAVAPRVAQPTKPAALDAPPRSSRVVGTAPVVKPSRSIVARRVGMDTLRGCATDGKRQSTNVERTNRGNFMINTVVGSCSVHLAGDGEFKFNEDFTDIASVEAGGYVVIEVDYGEHDRRVTFRSDGSALQRVYKVDGDVRPFDAEAQRWLTETLTYLLRRTGYAGEARAQWILEHRGVEGLLNEIAELGGDYARRIYYQAAIESGRLDVAAYERLITDAGKSVGSDYELAELLIAVSKAQPLTERMQAGFVTAAKSIGSDYERHRVLKAALSRRDLTPAVEAGMLDAAADINSDYELATLLIELNEARRIDDAVRPAYFKAANSLQSDYEHRRVLSAVVSREGMSPAMLLDVLESAKTINSDYELAELLTEVGGAYVLDDALRPAFFAAANTLNSDYEHGRTLLSVVERGDVTRPVALAVLESAKGISSDHELSELLIAVIRRVRMDDAVRAAVRADAETIGSQYDRGRVYEALGRGSN